MSLKSEVDQVFLAAVQSGNIRYRAWPTAGVGIADDNAWDNLFNAGDGPVVPYWLCGFSFGVATGLIVAEIGYEFSMGSGGTDGDGNAPANILITDWPVNFSAAAQALGPFAIPNQFLPYPIRIAAGLRMAARYTTLVGAAAITRFRVILATVVGG